MFDALPGYDPYRDAGDIYYYDDVRMDWYLANDGDDPETVQPDAEGWMVPSSRVNHNNGNPSSIEIQVYHFSGIQAASSSSSTPSSSRSSSGGGGGGGCFIGSVRGKSQSE